MLAALMDHQHALYAMAFGALVAIGELLSRYRDQPIRALLSLPGLVYTGINAVGALLAWFLIHVFDWKFISSENAQAVEWARILMAGFGSSALFRSSLVSMRAGDQVVAAGPGSFLLSVLRAADSAVDRLRAAARSKAVARTMSGVSFELAFESLPGYCLALMQNLPDEDQARLGKQLATIKPLNIDDEVKSLFLGLALMNVLGESVLAEAVKSLESKIRTPPTTASEPPPKSTAPAAQPSAPVNPVGGQNPAP